MRARDSALRLLSGAVDAPVVVWNPLVHSRTDMVTAHLDEPFAGAMCDMSGRALPTLIDGHTVTWRAEDIGSLGWQGYQCDADAEGSPLAAEIDGTTITNRTLHADGRPGPRRRCRLADRRRT